MKKHFAIGLVLMLLAAPVAFAGDDKASTSQLAKIIVINLEDIKIGTEAQHNDYVATLRRTSNRTPEANFNWIAARAVSGNTQNHYFFAGYGSYAEFEKKSDQFARSAGTVLTASSDSSRANADSHLNKKNTIAELREDISYRPERVDVANARAWMMSTVRLKPGTSSDFVEQQKQVIELHKANNIDESWAVYEVAFGSNTPTFLLFYPLKSLADLDDKTIADIHKRVFTPTVQRQIRSFTQDAVLTTESTLLRISPEISNPEATIVAANPSFWTVQERDETQVATARDKSGRKSAVEPASLKKEKKY